MWLPSRRRWGSHLWHSLREAASATNNEKARLRPTEPPNALPASERCPGQHKNVVGSFSLCTSSSPSVMAATIPAMCPAEFQQSLWRARTIRIARFKFCSKHENKPIYNNGLGCLPIFIFAQPCPGVLQPANRPLVEQGSHSGKRLFKYLSF